jgi:WD40 repeat protein
MVRFSLTQLFLMVALCGLAAALVATSRQRASYANIRCVAYSPDGRFVLAQYSSGRLRAWEMKRPDLPARDFACELRISGELVGTCEFNGRPQAVVLLVAGNTTSEIVVWDLKGNRETRSVSIPYLTGGQAVSAEGPLAATLSLTANGIDLWSLKTGKKIATLAPPTSSASFVWVRVSRGGKRVVAGYRASNTASIAAHEAAVWDLFRDGAPNASAEAIVLTPNSPKTTVLGEAAGSSVSLSGDGRRLGLCTFWPGALVWDLDTGKMEATISRPFVDRVALSPDGSLLAARRYGPTVEVWDVPHAALLAELTAPPRRGAGFFGYGSEDDVAFAPDGKRLCVAGLDTLVCWSVGDYRLLGTVPRHRWAIEVPLLSAGIIGWSVAWGLIVRRVRGKRRSLGRRLPAPDRMSASQLPGGDGCIAANEAIVDVPPRSLRVSWWLLAASGVTSILWGVHFAQVMTAQPFVPQPFCAFFAYYGVAAGVFALTKGVARDTRQLGAAAVLVGLSILECNFISFVLGIITRVLLGRADIERYVKTHAA